jgi:hypothetical protein
MIGGNTTVIRRLFTAIIMIAFSLSCLCVSPSTTPGTQTGERISNDSMRIVCAVGNDSQAVMYMFISADTLPFITGIKLNGNEVLSSCSLKYDSTSGAKPLCTVQERAFFDYRGSSEFAVEVQTDKGAVSGSIPIPSKIMSVTATPHDTLHADQDFTIALEKLKNDQEAWLHIYYNSTTTGMIYMDTVVKADTIFYPAARFPYSGFISIAASFSISGVMFIFRGSGTPAPVPMPAVSNMQGYCYGFLGSQLRALKPTTNYIDVLVRK